MKSVKPLSTNAKAQRAFRERLKEKGLTPHQVYILPIHKKILDAVEQNLRQDMIPLSLTQLTLENLSAMTIAWNTKTLHNALSDQQESASWNPTLASDESGHAVAINFTMPESGDLPVVLAVSGLQILVSSILFPAKDVMEPNALNEAALRVSPNTHLTGVGIQTIGGEDFYVAYGQLSSCAPLDNVMEEIRSLSHNAIDFVRLFSSFL